MSGLKVTNNGLSQVLGQMLDRGNKLDAYINRVLYPKYKVAQKVRWQTENASEGNRWKPLTTRYAEYKKVKYAGYAGEGKFILVATGLLSKQAMQQHNKMVRNGKLEISFNSSYASYVDEKRTFTKFSDKTKRQWAKEAMEYLVMGVNK